MDEKFKEKIREKLLILKEEVLQTLIEENNDFRAAVEDNGGKDLVDVASNDMDARTLEMIGAKDKLRLQRIEATLVRLGTDRFAVCISCGKKISPARIEAIPYVMKCISCQNLSESRHGQSMEMR